MLENARDLGAANENRKLRRRSKNVASMMLLKKGKMVERRVSDVGKVKGRSSSAASMMSENEREDLRAYPQ